MRKAYAIGIIVGCCVLFFDILTKWAVYTAIPPISTSFWGFPYGGIPIFQNFFGVEFSIVHATNKGAAWGALADYQIPLLILRILLLFALAGYLTFFNRHKGYVIPICLLIAGALGNVIDYFHYGVVIDMFKFVLWGYHYPVFNIADIAITIGIVWMILASFYHDRS